MMNSMVYRSFLTVVVILLPVLSSSAHAALGDFLYKWGEKYNLYNSRGIASDSSGNVYVADTGHSCVQVFSSTGVFIRKWGVNGTGDGQFQSPYAVAVDSGGDVYVVDSSRRNVQVFSNTGEFLRKWGSYGSGEGQFYNPSGIAVDANGNVFVVEDHTHRVQVFSSTGTFLRKWGSQGGADGQFQYPNAIAVDATGNVYVADTGNKRVQVFDSTGTFLRKWGTAGAGDGQFNQPYGIAVDSSDTVYVVDLSNYRVQAFSTTGTFLRKWGVMGAGDGQFMAPCAITVNPQGNAYVLDFSSYTANIVQVFDTAGVFVNKWTTNGTGNGQFNNPTGVAIDLNGDVYVMDTANNRVQVFTSTGEYLRKWGSSGSGDGQFNNAWGIAVDAAGNVYVADSGNARIQVFDSMGTFLGKWGSYGSGVGQLNYPRGLSVDAAGNVFVADTYNSRVQIFNNAGTFLKSFGYAGSGDGQLNLPWGIAVDGNGNVYVTEYNNNRVQVFNSAGAFIRKWGLYGSGDGQLINPEGISMDSAGHVYVIDTGNHRAQVFSNIGEFLGKWGGNGTGNGQFDYPVGVVVDWTGNVYVADFRNNRIQVFEGIRNCVLTANAGPDQTVEQASHSGAYVTLDGSGSQQQGCAEELTYAWTWPGGSAIGINPTVLLPPGMTTITLTIASGARTATDAVVVTVQDTQAPVTTSMISGLPGTNGWYVSDVAIFLNASDTGSGVKEIHYSVDASETIVTGVTASFMISADGSHGVSYFSKDFAGNSEAANSLTIMIDRTMPAIVAAQSPLPNANGWNSADVTVTFTCSDALSTIALCSSPSTVTTEGAAQVISGTAVDKAGNIAAASITANIDKTPPTILITGVADGAVYVPGAVPVPGYEVSDALSGVESHSANLSGGSTSNGTVYTYRVDARDKAGNTVSVAATYTMSYGFSGFLEPISLGKPFKLGSTIPVKFRLTDTLGNYVSTAIATIMVQQFAGDDPIGDPIILSSNGADTGNVFRYDAADNLYIFNLGTKDLVQGTWQIGAALDDGSVRSTFIQLKKN